MFVFCICNLNSLKEGVEVVGINRVADLMDTGANVWNLDMLQEPHI